MAGCSLRTFAYSGVCALAWAGLHAGREPSRRCIASQNEIAKSEIDCPELRDILLRNGKIIAKVVCQVFGNLPGRPQVDRERTRPLAMTYSLSAQSLPT